MIRLHRVSKIYPPRVPALDGVTLEIESGELVFLTGASGAGKTTLLRLLLGAELATTGQVIVDGRNVARLGRRGVAALRRTIGMVFQDAKLLPTLRVLENVAIAAEAVGEAPRESRRRAFHLLRELGLKDLIDRRPPTLSSGEQQRVALARALVNRPALLLADEPTGNLDPESSSRVLDLVVRAHRDGATVVVATHDEDLIRAVPGRVVVLHRGRVAGADDGVEGSDADPPALAASDRWVLR